jgi:hypothetical protein
MKLGKWIKMETILGSLLSEMKNPSALSPPEDVRPESLRPSTRITLATLQAQAKQLRHAA